MSDAVPAAVRLQRTSPRGGRFPFGPDTGSEREALGSTRSTVRSPANHPLQACRRPRRVPEPGADRVDHSCPHDAGDVGRASDAGEHHRRVPAGRADRGTACHVSVPWARVCGPARRAPPPAKTERATCPQPGTARPSSQNLLAHRPVTCTGVSPEVITERARSRAPRRVRSAERAPARGGEVTGLGGTEPERRQRPNQAQERPAITPTGSAIPDRGAPWPRRGARQPCPAPRPRGRPDHRPAAHPGVGCGP